MRPAIQAAIASSQPTVLIIDPQVIRQEVLGGLVERVRARSVVVGSTTEAMAMLAVMRPDLIVLADGPDLDAAEFCADVRSSEEHGRAALIVLACSARVGRILEVLEAGADDYVYGVYLKRPILLARIHNHLRRLCAERASTR